MFRHGMRGFMYVGVHIQYLQSEVPGTVYIFMSKSDNIKTLTF